MPFPVYVGVNVTLLMPVKTAESKFFFYVFHKIFYVIELKVH
jgi:hypothetical protein